VTVALVVRAVERVWIALALMVFGVVASVVFAALDSNP
jgi:hypothetical protein